MSSNDLSDERLAKIIENLCRNDSELEHVEFKENFSEHYKTGQIVCGMLNTLTLKHIPRGFLVWGVRDSDHSIIGTEFNPRVKKVKGREFDYWLKTTIEPTPDLDFRELDMDGKRIVVLIVSANPSDVYKCKKSSKEKGSYIRVGTSTIPLDKDKTAERELWKSVIDSNFETLPARCNISADEVMDLLDYDAFYRMRRNNAPVEIDMIFTESINCGMITDNRDGTYNISNFGALLYAKDIDQFPDLSCKMPRIITYLGSNKLNARNEIRGKSGYIVEFNRLLAYVMNSTIDREVINEDGIRQLKYLYPETTVRELMANMLAHQDLSTNTINPMVEIYENRIEFTNPGTPLIQIERIIDAPPQSRNEKITDEMFKVGICERRGSGWDKIAQDAKNYRFPAPALSTINNTINVTLKQHRELAELTHQERMWSIYIYASLLWTEKGFLTNALVRELFNIADENISMATALLNQAIGEGYIKVFDPQAGNKYRKYVPTYAMADISSPKT